MDDTAVDSPSHEPTPHQHTPHQSQSGEKPSAVVITVSDRSSRGERPDLSGPRAVALLVGAGIPASATIISDGAESVRDALTAAIASGTRLIITSGGTGLSERDQTPEGTRLLLTRELPGVAEALRREGAIHTPLAALSRGLAGVAGENPGCLVVNLPGSVGAVEQGMAVLLPILPHILDQLAGGDH